MMIEIRQKNGTRILILNKRKTGNRKKIIKMDMVYGIYIKEKR